MKIEIRRRNPDFPKHGYHIWPVKGNYGGIRICSQLMKRLFKGSGIKLPGCDDELVVEILVKPIKNRK